MEKAKKFFEEVIKTDEAKALFAATKQPETEDERIAAYLDIAKKLNAELTAEGIRAYFNVAVGGEVDDEELSQLTGGVDLCSSNYALNPKCKDSYMQRENCWSNDGCDWTIRGYSDYLCGATIVVGEFLMDL